MISTEPVIEKSNNLSVLLSYLGVGITFHSIYALKDGVSESSV